jgi:flagellar basal body-associated protein FliL
MAETKKDKQFFSIGRIFFLLIVIPLSLMAFLIANGIFKVGDSARERATTVLDQKSQEEIKIRAINTAEEVANFLRERENDVLVASILPGSEAAYKSFVDQKKRNLWVKDKDGKIQNVAAPLYSEMSLIDRSGNEIVRIVNGAVAGKNQLRNVAAPGNTTFKSEDYFSKAVGLGKGDVHVSHVTGWYVTRQDFEKGKRFAGVVRFATPIFDKGGLSGIVVLSLDYRHLAAFTDHIVPTQAEYVFEADASTGNYAYMVDNKGFIISHPLDFHITGLYPDGTPVPPLTKENYEALTKEGKEVLNLNLLGFMDPGLPEVAREAAAGKAGIKNYKFAGREKFVAFAPIKYIAKAFPEPAGFGWIGMGVDIAKFQEMATATAEKINQEVKGWTSTIVIIIIAAVILLFGISALLARGIGRSLDTEVPAGAEGVKEDLYDDEEEK